MSRPGRRRRPNWRHLMLRRVVQVLERRPELAGIHAPADLLAEHATWSA